jgi:D-alanyl-D-alanine carboxypeptidase/D-alanyl-D-alanine-endopeptidase (penicillin-binding protein 4)
VDRSGHIRPGSFVPEEKAGEPTVLGETVSAPIADIARITNVRSDNFYAEALFRAMGEDRTGVALFDSCLVAQRQVLTELNVDPDGVRQVDGCGLSRMNYVSPEWMVGFLQAMQQSPAFGAFLSSLPHPGEGTLSALLPSQAGRERICIKSGSMDGVLCYSGYILAPDGTPEVTLSIMTNHTTATPKEVRAVLAHLLKLLMEEI